MQMVSREFRARGTQGLRASLSEAECFIVSQDTDRAATRRYGDLKVSFVSLESLVNVLAPSVE
jgi:hypothetical protein